MRFIKRQQPSASQSSEIVTGTHHLTFEQRQEITTTLVYYLTYLKR